MKTLINIVLLLFVFCSQAQPPSKFYTKFGSNGYEYGYDVKQTLDNGYIICGSTSSFGQGNTDAYLVKLDSMGQIKFEKTFGGFQNDCAKSVIQLSDSNYIITGYTNSFGVGGYDFYLAKIDKQGNLIWEKTLGGNDWDFAYSVEETNDGGYVIGGTTYSYGRGVADGYIVKTDANGSVLWTKIYGGKFDDEFKSIIQTQDGGLALTGYSKSYNDTINGDVWLFKLDINGDSTWCKFYGGTSEDYGNHLIQHANSDYYIAGSSASIGLGMRDAYVVRTDNSGILIWQQVDGYSNHNESFNSVTISKKDPSISCYAETETFTGYGIHIKILELGSSSFYHNATEYGETKSDEIFKLISTKDKGYAGIGYTYSFGAALSDGFFLKMDSNLVGSISIVSVNEISNQNNILKIYPNPSNDKVVIVLNHKTELNSIDLIDIAGKKMDLNSKINYRNSNEVHIDVAEFPDGIYFLKSGNYYHKISIIH